MMNDSGYDADNLQKLATFLAYGNLPGVVFDMEWFSEWRRDDATMSNLSERAHSTCGTVGCALGWATYIIPKPFCMNMDKYSSRFFLAPHTERLERWAWMFSADWASADNSRLGAAKRIQWLLDHDGNTPNNWDYIATTVEKYKHVHVKGQSDAADWFKPEMATSPNSVVQAWAKQFSRSPLTRMDDGIPNLVDRVRSLGNSIVPQIAYEIFKAIETAAATGNR